jgi:hypothetical protein
MIVIVPWQLANVEICGGAARIRGGGNNDELSPVRGIRRVFVSAEVNAFLSNARHASLRASFHCDGNAIFSSRNGAVLPEVPCLFGAPRNKVAPQHYCWR